MTSNWRVSFDFRTGRSAFSNLTSSAQLVVFLEESTSLSRFAKELDDVSSKSVPFTLSSPSPPSFVDTGWLQSKPFDKSPRPSPPSLDETGFDQSKSSAVSPPRSDAKG